MMAAAKRKIDVRGFFFRGLFSDLAGTTDDIYDVTILLSVPSSETVVLHFPGKRSADAEVCRSVELEAEKLAAVFGCGTVHIKEYHECNGVVREQYALEFPVFAKLAPEMLKV